MASQIIIGRFGLDIETSEIDTWDMGGDRVQVSGEVYCDSVAEALAARQQILGLAENNDEPLVPVYWVEDTSLDGMYEVVSSRVETAQMTLTNGVLPWSAVLRRPRGGSSMITESILAGAGRDGFAFVLTPRYWLAAPGGSTTSIQSLSVGSARNPYNATTGEPMQIFEGSSLANTTATSYAPPTSHYDGAPTLRVGDPLYTVVGRQIANTPLDWEIDNGLIKVSAPATLNDLCDVQFYPSSGTALPTVTYPVRLGSFSAGSWANTSTVPQVITCNRNGREEVTIRLRTAGETIDISVRRGDRGAIFTVRGSSTRHGLAWKNTLASTTIDASNKGIYANAADADAIIPILVASGTVTRDTTNGRVYRSANGTSVQVYVGSSYTGAAAPDTAVWLQEAFFAAMGETARVVAVG